MNRYLKIKSTNGSNKEFCVASIDDERINFFSMINYKGGPLPRSEKLRRLLFLKKPSMKIENDGDGYFLHYNSQEEMDIFLDVINMIIGNNPKEATFVIEEEAD